MAKGTNANSLKNLKPNESTQFTSGRNAVENGRKGGLKAQANRRTREAEKKEWAELLSLAMNDGIEEDITNLKEAPKKNLTVSKAMKVKLITQALKGDIRAYETIMRYAGADEQDTTPEQEEQPEDNSFIKALNARAEDLWKDDSEANEETEKK